MRELLFGNFFLLKKKKKKKKREIESRFSCCTLYWESNTSQGEDNLDFSLLVTKTLECTHFKIYYNAHLNLPVSWFGLYLNLKWHGISSALSIFLPNVRSFIIRLIIFKENIYSPRNIFEEHKENKRKVYVSLNYDQFSYFEILKFWKKLFYCKFLHCIFKVCVCVQ